MGSFAYGYIKRLIFAVFGPYIRKSRCARKRGNIYIGSLNYLVYTECDSFKTDFVALYRKVGYLLPFAAVFNMPKLKIGIFAYIRICHSHRYGAFFAGLVLAAVICDSNIVGSNSVFAAVIRNIDRFRLCIFGHKSLQYNRCALLWLQLKIKPAILVFFRCSAAAAFDHDKTAARYYIFVLGLIDLIAIVKGRCNFRLYFGLVIYFFFQKRNILCRVVFFVQNFVKNRRRTNNIIGIYRYGRDQR